MREQLIPEVTSPAQTRDADVQVLKTNAELNKLGLEAKKIEFEIKNLRRPPIFHPSAWIPVLSSLIALSGVMANLWFTTQQKNIAVAAQKEAEVKAEGAQSYATSLKRELDNNDGLPAKSVNIRFRGALSREDVTAFQQGLIASGFIASAPVRTSEVTQNSVTYYHVNDEANAQDVLNRATEFFSQRGCPITFQPPSTAPAMNNKPGTIHVDIYHSCQID